MAKHFKEPTPSHAQSGTQMPNGPAMLPVVASRASQTGAYVGRDARKAKPRRRKTFSTVLLVAGISLLLIAGGLWGFAQWQYSKQNATNAKLAEYATISDTEDTGPVVDWDALKVVNEDVIGWIEIPGTVVNYPVYKGEDNDEYLHLNAEGEYTIGGQIFMDYQSASPGLVDRQTLIYGHHLYNGTMFTAVDDMCNQDKFDAVDTIWYATEQETYELEPLFIYKTDAYNADACQLTFASDDDFHSYLAGYLAQASAQSSDAASAVANVTKVITLATCDYNNDFGVGNGRSLLVCALKSEVNTSASD